MIVTTLCNSGICLELCSQILYACTLSLVVHCSGGSIVGPQHGSPSPSQQCGSRAPCASSGTCPYWLTVWFGSTCRSYVSNRLHGVWTLPGDVARASLVTQCQCQCQCQYNSSSSGLTFGSSPGQAMVRKRGHLLSSPRNSNVVLRKLRPSVNTMDPRLCQLIVYKSSSSAFLTDKARGYLSGALLVAVQPAQSSPLPCSGIPAGGRTMTLTSGETRPRTALERPAIRAETHA